MELRYAIVLKYGSPFMERKIILTEDGSHTISIPEMGVTYHSIHGAIQESQHVFIEAGLHYVSDILKVSDTVRIFEMGFGTGLNALLTYLKAEKSQLKIYYETIEPLPLNKEEVRSLNYCQQLNRSDLQSVFKKFHFCEWKKEIQLSSIFVFKKSINKLINHLPNKSFSLIYFDAFDPNIQPELWTKEVFKKLFSIIESNGILVTYSSKSDVRRAMQAAGFKVEKIPGAKGKREMIRAIKTNFPKTVISFLAV